MLGWALGEGQYMGQESIFSYVIIVYRSSFIGKFILKIPASQIDFKYIEKKTSKNFSKKKTYPFGPSAGSKCTKHLLN